MASHVSLLDPFLVQKHDVLEELLQLTEELLARTHNLRDERADDIQHLRGDIQQHQSEVGRLLAEIGQMRRMVELVNSLRTIARKECDIRDNLRDVNETYGELIKELGREPLDENAVVRYARPWTPEYTEPSNSQKSLPSSNQSLRSSVTTTPLGSTTPGSPLLRKRAISEELDAEADVRPRKRVCITLDLRTQDEPAKMDLQSSLSSSLSLRYPESVSSDSSSRAPSPSQPRSSPLAQPSSSSYLHVDPLRDPTPKTTGLLEVSSSSLHVLSSPPFRPKSPSMSEIITGAGPIRPLTAQDMPWA